MSWRGESVAQRADTSHASQLREEPASTRKGRRRGAARSRDAERSRAAILDAAESQFADRGVSGASLAAIAKVAGVSAALPAYFFGCKEDLYDAVIERILAKREAHVVGVRMRAEKCLDGSRAGTEAALRELVAGYIGFLLDNPSFVPLLTRDALSRTDSRERMPRHAQAFAESLRGFLSRAGASQVNSELDHLLLTVIAMCYFPLEHDATIVAGMGHRAWSESFQAQRVEHIVDLLMPSFAPS
jgi:AcrR family transcriptional regulator